MEQVLQPVDLISFPNPEYKQVIVLRTDLKMGKGKLVTQGAHAAVEAALIARQRFPQIFENWHHNKYKKIALQVNSQDELLHLYREIEDCGLPCALILDDFEELDVPTAIGIGPYIASEIDILTKNLKLL
jgi:PTH2 family peptidyl-tRNA hydrolase